MRTASPRKTVVSNDGLRYLQKVAGSQFDVSPSNGYGARVMSCFRCGKHKMRNLLVARRYLGQTQYVCSPAEPCERGPADGRDGR